MENSEEDPTPLWHLLSDDNRIGKKEQDENNAEDELKKSCFHKFLIFVRFIVIVAAFDMLVGQIVSLSIQNLTPTGYVLRFYIILISAVIVFNELEWFRFILNNSLLHNFFTRGLFYAFIGVIGIEQSNADRKNAASDSKLLYIEIVSWGMIASGLLYVVMGLICLQPCYENTVKSYQNRIDESKSRK